MKEKTLEKGRKHKINELVNEYPIRPFSISISRRLTTQIFIFIIILSSSVPPHFGLVPRIDKIVSFFIFSLGSTTDCVDVSISVKLKFGHVLSGLFRRCSVKEPFSVSRESDSLAYQRMENGWELLGCGSACLCRIKRYTYLINSLSAEKLIPFFSGPTV